MLSTVLASAALLAAPALAQVGQAIVVNSCDYNVYLFNTPSAGGGFSAIDKTLSTGDSYSQTFTPLSNGNGWSIKLSKSMELTEIMQYEYTYQSAETIWYDLSDVNGNPWDGNWEITATGDCTPRQAAYRFSTDDAYGMQACPASASITVTLCSGTSGGSSGGSSAAPSSPAESAPPSTPSSPAAPSSPPPATSSPPPKHHHHHSFNANEKAVAPSPSVAAEKMGPNDDGVTVTNVKTVITTAFVTATAAPHKRHEHVARHAHGH